MTLVAAERIYRKFDDQVILDGVSFTIGSDHRIGLVGRNGSGKTTLFDIIAEKQETDSGVINRSKACIVDYIEQETASYSEMSLFDYVASARDDLLTMRREIAVLEDRLERFPGDREALTKLGTLQNRYDVEGGFNLENDIGTILYGLGFEKTRYIDRMRNFSGGERNRAGLARALAGKGNLLLLDEPTNHLDIESTRWLEEYLANLEKSYMVVSHDRAFLTATVDKVWELSHGKIDFYTGGLEHYLAERTERRRLQEHHYRHQQEEIKRLEEYVRRNMAGQKTKQAQSKLKFLGRIKRLPPPRSDGTKDRISMNSSGRSFAHVLSIEDVSLGYGTDPIVRNISFDIYRGDKVGLIGRNGSGKTTLLKSLVGELTPIAGDIQLGNKVDVAYFDQELSDLNLNETVLDSLWSVDPSAEIGKIRSFTARFGFIGEDVFKLVASLSGGEKTKLSLARLLYHPANFIIFDEPTNHLDMDSRENLEKALLEYDGCCLIVSHDRFFLDQVVNRIMNIDNGILCVYEGNYSYFREKTESVPVTAQAYKPKSKDAYLTFKEKSKRRSRHRKSLAATRGKIVNMESELKRLDLDIRDNIPRSDWEQLHQATDRKHKLEDELLHLYVLLEELEQTELDD
ncbi:MAG: ABC-F family ATP-binding cassette domain-containing protein [candidate division Zixibacteria bacterium]|nr:ABC-F family ATP-binding cassette domain-containing protein [candidate division Zixibacteria bacterium]